MVRLHALFCSMAALLLIGGCHHPSRCWKEEAMADRQERGFVARTVELDGKVYRYAEFVPYDYTPQKKWPAILFMNGAGERGDDGMKHTAVGLGKAIREHPERFSCIVVMPQCQPDQVWEGKMVDLALATLEKAMARYNIDEKRVALTGLSLGGFGTWLIGAQQPERFSCLVPICGGGDTAQAKRLSTVPIWCFHGSADPVVPVDRSRDMVEAVRAAGGDVRYTEYPEVGHNAWDRAYGDAELIAWMLAQHR